MSSLNPSRVYGVGDRKGSLHSGKDADFVVIDEDYQVVYTYREGRKIYDAAADTDLFNAEFLEAAKIN